MTAAAPARRRLRGLRLVPFDRNTEGVSQSAPLWLNQSALRLIDRDGWYTLDRPRRGAVHSIAPPHETTRKEPRLQAWWQRHRPLISLRQYKWQASEAMDRWRVRYETVTQPAESLSLRGLREAGAGVLLVSSDLDELFELSDRLLVMYGGRIVAEFDGPYDRRAVGDAMTGAVR